MHFFFRRKSVLPTQPTRLSDWLLDLKQQVAVAQAPEVVADMAQIETISSKELGELAKIHLCLRQSDRKLVVENVEASVMEVFEMTRMNRLVEVRCRESLAVS